MGAFVRSEQLKGARLGPYEIVRLIGHGATASVFEGVHVALGKPVAIKVLHEHLADDEQVRGRFLREGRVAAKLRHPHIVDVIDVGEESGTPYLVMELLAGSDLRALLADAHLLTLEHALGFLLPIAAALGHAHDAGVIHRDLKPANIFLARDVRDDIVPKLVDFGLSKVESGETTSSLTATELVAGTILYMAPEQTLGVRYASPASDQYSLATILYECVTGEPPFAADGVYALIEKIRNELVRPPSLINARLPEAFDTVILRALHREPAKRFSNVRVFARAFLPYAAETTVQALQRDFVDRPSGSARKLSVGAQSAAAQVAVTRIEPPTSSAKVEAAHEVSAIHECAPLPCPPGDGPFRMKGMSYRGVVHMLNTLVPGGLDAFVKDLDDPRLGAFVRQPFLAQVRYDIFPMLPLFVALARKVNVPFEQLVRETSAAQARYDARTVFRAMWEGATVASIAGRMARFGTQYYDFGKLSGTVPQPNLMLVTHAGMPEYAHPWHWLMHVSYVEECARLLGGLDVTSTLTKTRSGTLGRYPLVNTVTEVRWRESGAPAR